MKRWFWRPNRYQYKSNKKLSVFVLPILIFLLSMCVLFVFDKKILPAAIEISHVQARTQANKIINDSVNKTLEDMKVESSDFFAGNTTEGMNAFSVNTVLINTLCSNLSKNMTEKLERIENEKISIPMGSLSGTTIFSNVGPNIVFYMKPMGDTLADYETQFASVGINQTNFKIWLNIKLEIQIVNPLLKEKVTMTRKIMLVDTVIHGEVPDRYLDI